MLMLMNVIIVGGGEIGAQVAEALQQAHSVTVIDTDAERSQAFETVDVRFIQGNGADPEDLRAADAHKRGRFYRLHRQRRHQRVGVLSRKGLRRKGDRWPLSRASATSRRSPSRA